MRFAVAAYSRRFGELSMNGYALALALGERPDIPISKCPWLTNLLSQQELIRWDQLCR